MVKLHGRSGLGSGEYIDASSWNSYGVVDLALLDW